MLSRAISKRLPGNAAQFSHDLASPQKPAFAGVFIFSLHERKTGKIIRLVSPW
jgi:hypothetical protein